MRSRLQRLTSGGSAVSRFCALLGMLALVVFTSMTILDVMMRWLLNSPINGVSDVGPLVVAIVTAAFFPLALAERSHVSMTFLGSFLGPRVGAWLDAFAALVTWVFFILLAWQLVRYSVETHRGGETTWVVQIPVAPWWSAVSLFILVCVVVQLGVVVAEIARGRRRLDGQDETRARPDDASA
jgi:TRAP-type C4-dicarboxylate transport system permease small subunit